MGRDQEESLADPLLCVPEPPLPAPMVPILLSLLWQEGSRDGKLRYLFSQGPCPSHLKLHKQPASEQMHLVSTTYSKIGGFAFPKSFSPRRADKGLIICGDE